MSTKLNTTRIKLISLVSLLLIAGLAFYFGYLTPKKVTSYMGINLGDSTAEVAYVLGMPDDADNGSQKWYKNSNNQSDGFLELDTWSYRNEKRTLTIYFDDSHKVDLIICYIDEEKGINTVGECKINDVGTKDTEEQVLNKLGPPESIEISKDGNKRMNYNKLNMLVLLKKKSVWALLIGKEIK